MYQVYREKDGKVITIALVETIEDAAYTMEEARELWGPEWALHLQRQKPEVKE